MSRKKVLEDELNDLEGKLQRAEKLVTGMTQRMWVSHILLCNSSACQLPRVHTAPDDHSVSVVNGLRPAGSSLIA
jgi:hypothetical protein